MISRGLYVVLGLFLLIIFASCKKDVSIEVEPNDSFGNAGIVTLDLAIQGVLSTRDDIDVYGVEIRSPSIIEVSLSPVRGVNHAIKIWKGEESPVLIKYIDDMRKSSPERMTNLYVEAGMYYISIGYGERDLPVADPTGKYTLEVKSRAWSDEEREPNDSPADASELIPGRDIKGFFSPAYNRMNVQGENPLREEDWYRVNIDLLMEKPVLLDVDLTGVERINSVLGIYNSRMEQVGFADTAGVHEGESIRETGITESGEYFVLVASKNFEANHDQEYRLTVRTREFESGMEMEPNNDLMHANTITSDEISGRIFPAGDRDVFVYHGIGRGLYRIELNPPQTIDLMLEIMAQDGAKLFEADNGGAGYSEVIPAVFISGKYFVSVQSRKSSSDSDRAYTLKVVSLTGTEEYEAEPNDRKEHATPFSRSTIKGFTSKRNDRDFYSLDYGRRVRKSFSLQGVPNALLKISITDSFGYSIKSEEVKGAQSVRFTETIDQKGFVIIDSLKENYDEPYILQVMEAK